MSEVLDTEAEVCFNGGMDNTPCNDECTPLTFEDLIGLEAGERVFVDLVPDEGDYPDQFRGTIKLGSGLDDCVRVRTDCGYEIGFGPDDLQHAHLLGGEE